jgi:ribonuclease R
MKKSQREKYQKALMDFLKSRPEQAYKRRDLARKLGVPNRDYQAFKRMVQGMHEAGKLRRYKGNRFGALTKPVEVEGILHVKTQGYGFIRREAGEDVFVSQRNMASAVHGDRVRVLLWAHRSGRLAEGQVTAILERKRKRVVGLYQDAGKNGYVTPDELKMNRDIFVRGEKAGKAKNGQKVVVEVQEWGDGRRMPEGMVVSVLGYPDAPGVDVLSVIYQQDLAVDFPGEVEKEAEAAAGEITAEDLEGRLDLRDRLTFTIDPADAKDFDDAVSLELLDNGNLSLGVHIADVSRFVEEGSALDREALRRGTSVYLVDRTIPMLPHRLSSDLCSLQPEKERLAYSVMMELTPSCGLEDYRITPSVIRSGNRLTYRQAQDILDKMRKPFGKWPDIEGVLSGGFSDGSLEEVLFMMALMSRRLKAMWRSKGSIDFDAPEVEVTLDEKGRVVDLKPRERLDSHQLIEAFMLLANQTVASHIQTLRQETAQRLPFVYRIHERPGGEKLETFTQFVRAMGYSFSPGKKVSPKAFQNLLKQVKGTPREVLIEEVALRTMMKAKYDTRNVGHFGLAFSQYTHFTSPIRRYPDLCVHRLLKAYSRETPGRPSLAAPLARICEIASEREVVAEQAERESIRAKQVAFMEQHIGDVYEGIISGVTSFGLFVEIPQFLVEGLVSMKTLADDYYLFDAEKYQLKGENRGKVYQLGDPVRVRVDRVLKQMRKMDFTLA